VVYVQVHGFKGNSEDYYAPDNSCINRVLETKRGRTSDAKQCSIVPSSVHEKQTAHHDVTRLQFAQDTLS
jgi:hypothetical protein